MEVTRSGWGGGVEKKAGPLVLQRGGKASVMGRKTGGGGGGKPSERNGYIGADPGTLL